jgi:hypothetical protein
MAITAGTNVNLIASPGGSGGEVNENVQQEISLEQEKANEHALWLLEQEKKKSKQIINLIILVVLIMLVIKL